MLHYLVNARNHWQAELAEQWRFFPSTLWVLLGLFPVSRLYFQASHHATCCARRSLISISTCCVYMLSLWSTHSPLTQYCVRPRACSRAQELSMHLSSRSSPYSLDIVWHWQENARIQAKSHEKSRFSQFLLGWSQRWSLIIIRFWVFSNTICW